MPSERVARRVHENLFCQIAACAGLQQLAHGEAFVTFEPERFLHGLVYPVPQFGIDSDQTHDYSLPVSFSQLKYGPLAGPGVDLDQPDFPFARGRQSMDNRSMSRKNVAFLLCSATLVLVAAIHSVPATAGGSSLEAAIAGAHRDPANRARDLHRHPRETLEFFGLKPEQSVVEIWPAAGWYTEILAPVLRDHGRLHVAVFVLGDQSPEYQRRIQAAFLDRLKTVPEIYDRVQVSEMGAGSMEVAPAASADLVLTFRNVHNWMKAGFAPDAFAAFFRALKPGGALGVVEHRAKPGTSLEKMIESGYVTEQEVIRLATAAGFVLEERSEINANPRDTTEHPQGVWSLPPAMAGCRQLPEGAEQESCRSTYQQIGESDRMTLRFRKPAA